MQINKKDVLWNYGATFLKIASAALLFPFILKMMPSETVGIWIIFMTITSLGSLLDFGFSSSFTRNVTYVFSGVRNLKINGYETVNKEDLTIDFGLLKGVISTMRWFYSRVALSFLFLITTLGTYYMYVLMQNYKGDQQEVYIAWILLCLISTYNLYTLYYDSLLQGKGLIKRSKQIVILGQTAYLIFAVILIMRGNGLIAIISAQTISVIIIRWFSYRFFFTSEIKLKLRSVISRSKSEILKAVYPNAIKMGITGLGTFMVLRSAIIIGSLYLPLSDIASYGITMQLIAVITSLSGIYTATYQPKIVQLRVTNNNQAIKELYLKGQIVLIFTYIIGGLGLIFFGKYMLNIIESKTLLIPTIMVSIALFASFLETNHSIAGGILLTKNEVPFFKAGIISGIATIILLFVFLHFTNLGILAMILAPAISQLLYQNWKWPMEVHSELKITYIDIYKIPYNIIKKIKLS